MRYKLKSFLITTAIFEGLTGLALAFAPSFIASKLLGTFLTEPAAILIARLAGASLISLAFACWLSRNDTQSSVMVKAMLGYNIFSIFLLVYVLIFERISGPGLWPALLLHVGLLVWCLSSFFNIKRLNDRTGIND
jgi:hypothetical protein